MINNDYGYNYSINSAKIAEGPTRTDINGTITYGLYNNSIKILPTGSDPTHTIATGTHQWAGLTNETHNNYTYIGTIPTSTTWYVNQSFTLDANTTNWAQQTNMSFSVNFYALQNGVPAGAQPTPQTPGHAHP
jgi:hypothetical protein